MCKVDVMMLESSRERGWDYSLVSRCLETERGLAELHTRHPLIPASTTHNALVMDENCMQYSNSENEKYSWGMRSLKKMEREGDNE